MLPVWRSRLIRLLPALLAAALLASGCASPRAPVIATDLDADRVIGLRVGQSLVITLPADRDSGRQWQLEQPTLQALANDTNEPLEFYLLGRNSDPDFASATAGLAESRDQVLLFDSARAQDPDAAGWRLLHPGAHASAESAVPIHRPPLGDTPGTTTTPPLAGALPAADRRVPPAFVLRIRIETPVATLGQRWCVALQARATHWKYLLPADWAVQAPQVVDIDQRVGFESPRPEPLDDGRSTAPTRRSFAALAGVGERRRPAQGSGA